MSEPSNAEKKTETDVTTTEDDRQVKGQTVLKAVGLGVGLVAVLFLGGAGIAWLIQGTIFYESKEIEVQATVVGNGQGALGIDAALVSNQKAKANFVDKRHWLVLSYPGCEGSLQGFWIPDEPRAGAKQAGLLSELRACFLPLTVGARSTVKVLTRRNRSSGSRSWRVHSVGDCDARQIETILHPRADAQKCEWM